MAYSPYSTSVMQFSRETTAGTVPTDMTDIWRGEFSMLEDTRERVIVAEQVGAFTQSERSYDAKLQAAWSQPSTPMTFEQVCHILEGGVKTATPSGSGPYVRVYNYPYTGTSVNTIKTYAFRGGSAIVAEDVYQSGYGFVESFEFSGSFGESWTMSSNWICQQMSAGVLTSGLSLDSVNEVLFPQTLLYIDASGGTIGTTQMSGVLMSASINVTTGLMPVPVGDGQLYYTTYKWTQPEVTFSLTLELEDSSVVADERDAYRANNIRLIRLKSTNAAGRIFQADMAAKYDNVGPYTNSDGNTTVTIDGHMVASAADSLALAFTITNGVATL